MWLSKRICKVPHSLFTHTSASSFSNLILCFIVFLHCHLAPLSPLPPSVSHFPEYSSKPPYPLLIPVDVGIFQGSAICPLISSLTLRLFSASVSECTENLTSVPSKLFKSTKSNCELPSPWPQPPTAFVYCLRERRHPGFCCSCQQWGISYPFASLQPPVNFIIYSAQFHHPNVSEFWTPFSERSHFSRLSPHHLSPGLLHSSLSWASCPGLLTSTPFSTVHTKWSS